MARKQQPLSIHELALELQAVDEVALHRVMRALAHLGVFEEAHQRYGLTPASRMLVRESDNSLAPMVMYVNYEHSQSPWQCLHDAVLTGKNPFEAAHGKSSWEYSDVDARYGELWNAMNRVQGGEKIEALKRCEGLRDVRTLVDVGGNNGATVAAIVAAHPHSRGINFDLPHVVADGVHARGLEHVGGSLLLEDDQLPTGDAMLLKNVVY